MHQAQKPVIQGEKRRDHQGTERVQKCLCIITGPPVIEPVLQFPDNFCRMFDHVSPVTFPFPERTVFSSSDRTGESGVLSARRKDLNNINYSRLRFEVHPEWISLQKSSFVTYLELSQDDLYISSDLS